MAIEDHDALREHAKEACRLAVLTHASHAHVVYTESLLQQRIEAHDERGPPASGRTLHAFPKVHYVSNTYTRSERTLVNQMMARSFVRSLARSLACLLACCKVNHNILGSLSLTRIAFAAPDNEVAIATMEDSALGSWQLLDHRAVAQNHPHFVAASSAVLVGIFRDSPARAGILLKLLRRLYIRSLVGYTNQSE